VCVCVCVCVCVPGSIREMAMCMLWAGFPSGDGHICCEPGSLREMAIHVVSRVPFGRWPYMLWAGFY